MAERFDLHTHTPFSDGKAPLGMNVRSAEAAGLVAMAVTDHLFSPGRISGGATLDEYLAAIAEAQETTSVRLLRGVEAQALDAAGATAVDAEARGRLEIVLCDLGGNTRGIFEDAPASSAALLESVRRCYLGLAENPLIDVLAHPFNLGRLGRDISPSGLPRSLVAEVVGAMAANGKAFEVMNDFHYWYPDLSVSRIAAEYAEIVALAAEAGCQISVGSDAHFHQGVGHLTWVWEILGLAGVGDERLVDWRRFLKTT